MTEDQRAELLRRLDECQNNRDTEMAHSDADDVLCEALQMLGYSDLVDAWLKVSKWYS